MCREPTLKDAALQPKKLLFLIIYLRVAIRVDDNESGICNV